MAVVKRLAAPKTYPIPRKVKKFAPVIKGGGHKHEEAVPLRVILRDMLNYAKNAKEAKKIVHMGHILVDNKVRKDDRFGVGLMDTLSIPAADKYYRAVPKGARLKLIEIPEDEAALKLCRIEDKKVVKGGNIQLNLHDGRNILIKVKDPFKPVEDVYKTHDVLLISLPDQKIVKHLKMEEGKLAMIVRGKLAGKIGKIKKIEIIKGLDPNRVTLEIDGNDVTTLMDYVFVVGDEKPVITVTEEKKEKEGK